MTPSTFGGWKNAIGGLRMELSRMMINPIMALAILQARCKKEI